MKKLLCLILLISIFLCSCRDSRKVFVDIKEDFSRFSASSDVALNVEDEKIYFQDYEIDLDDLIKDDSNIYRVQEVVLRNDKMYLLVSRKANRRWSFSICQCDLKGNNLQILHEQKDLDSEVDWHRSDGLLYIEYKLQKTVYVDLFNCNIEEYSSLGSGKDISWKDYYVKLQRAYFVEKSKKGFVISDDTKEIAVIDDDFLKDTEYYDLMQKHRFSPFSYSLAEDKITLMYRGPHYWNCPAILIFEYDVATENLIYLAVMDPYDCGAISVRYNMTN